MKRSTIRRRTPLAARSAFLRSQPLKRTSILRARTRKRVDPAAVEYKRIEMGRCQVCGAIGLVRRHHVVLEQHCRRDGLPLFDLRNAMWVGIEGHTCRCHDRHHAGVARIPIDLIPDAALAFAAGHWGDERASDYFGRYYAAPRGVA